MQHTISFSASTLERVLELQVQAEVAPLLQLRIRVQTFDTTLLYEGPPPPRHRLFNELLQAKPGLLQELRTRALTQRLLAAPLSAWAPLFRTLREGDETVNDAVALLQLSMRNLAPALNVEMRYSSERTFVNFLPAAVFRAPTAQYSHATLRRLEQNLDNPNAAAVRLAPALSNLEELADLIFSAASPTHMLFLRSLNVMLVSLDGAHAIMIDCALACHTNVWYEFDLDDGFRASGNGTTNALNRLSANEPIVEFEHAFGRWLSGGRKHALRIV